MIILSCRYSQTCLQRPPLGPQKSNVVQRLRHRWPLFTVYYYKILEKLGLSWPLFRGGRCSEVAVNTSFTVMVSSSQLLSLSIFCLKKLGFESYTILSLGDISDFSIFLIKRHNGKNYNVIT
jgi:hypothetical protein